METVHRMLMSLCSAAMATRELRSSQLMAESVWRERRPKTGGLSPGLFFCAWGGVCCVMPCVEGRCGQNVKRCQTPCCCYLYTFTCSHSRLIESAWAGVKRGSYIMNGRKVALFWTWKGTKCVNVYVCGCVGVCVCLNRGPTCSLTAPLHPWRADTHMHWHTVWVTWFHSKDRGASCSRGKAWGTELCDLSRMISRGVWRRWHRLAVSPSLSGR